MLKQFRALPTEQRARDMKSRDYLWCLAQTLLDREEELERLCPACREKAMEERCLTCGAAVGNWGEWADNPNFETDRFEKLKGGSRRD